MAPPAVGAKLPVMDVVARVAIAAAAAQIHLDFKGLPVTGVAADGAMRAVEQERSLCVVIKAPLRPVDRRMAHCAIIGESIVVRIVVCVTGAAVLRCVPEYLRLVAGRTIGVKMLAEQWEMRQVMIEKQVLLPRVLIVTICALCALGSGVRIVILVAFAATCEWFCFE